MHVLYRRRRCLAITTVAAWITLLIAALPWVDWADDNVTARLALAAVCVVGSMLSVLLACQRSVDEVWEMGRESGRREALRELNRTGTRVVHLRRPRVDV